MQSKNEASAPENESAAAAAESPTVELEVNSSASSNSNQMQVAEENAEPAEAPAPQIGKIFDFEAYGLNNSGASQPLTYAQVAAKGAAAEPAPMLQLSDQQNASTFATEPSTQMLPHEHEPATNASHQTIMSFLESSTFPLAGAERDRADEGFKSGEENQGAGQQADVNSNMGENSNSNVDNHEAEDKLQAPIANDGDGASANSKKLTLDLDL